MRRIADIIFPAGLWTRDFTYWWVVSMVMVFWFDIMWMMQTTFRPMSYFAFYPVLLLSAFVLALPSLFLTKGVLQTLWLLFFDALFIANLMYCRTYYNAIPLQSYNLMGNLADFKASVWDSFKWYYGSLPLLTIVAFAFYSLRKRKSVRLPSLITYVTYIVVLGIITWASDAWRGGIMKRMDFMANYAYLSSSIVPIYSIGGFLVHDYFKNTETLKPEDKEEVMEWLDFHQKQNKNYWESGKVIRINPRRNLVLILCESLESWVIDRKIEGREITPFLNSLLKDSTTFYAPYAKTQVGSGRSIDAQLLILSGLLPMRNQAYAYSAIQNKFFTIPDAFKSKEGKTVLFTCDKPYVWNQALVAEAFGIDSLVWAKDFDIDETAGPSKRLSDGSFMRQIVEKLKKGDIWSSGAPAMIMAVTYSGHNPFHLPEHLQALKLNGEYPEIIKNYIVTANYTDSSLKTLVDYLKEREDWEETIVVITGDHEGLASDRQTALKNPLSAQFVDPGQHTPLIILNSPVAGRYDSEFDQVDIYSTILDLMDFNDYPWKGLGYSILDPDYPTEHPDINTGVVPVDTTVSNHLKHTPEISDLILKFDLLKNYPQEKR